MKLNLSGHDGCRAVMNSDLEVLYPYTNEKSLYKLNLNDHSAAQDRHLYQRIVETLIDFFK